MPFVVAALALAAGGWVPGSFAQIYVPEGGVTLTFDSAPPITEWAALSVGFDNGAGVITTAAELDAQVQQLSVTDISNALPSSSIYPPAQANYARWNSTQHLLQSRPGNNWCAVLAGTFVNSAPSPAQTIGISFDLGGGLTSPETIAGFRVYFSLTGEQGSWRVIESLSTGVTGRVAVVTTLFPSVWFPGASLYLLWADDNGPNSDGYYTIDNLTMDLSPALRATRVSATEIELAWPDGWNNCYLETATNLVGGTWSNASGGDDLGVVTCTNGVCGRRIRVNQQRFFRMHCGILIP